MNRRTVLSLSALAALTLGLVALAGPINPPAGPIVPTNKTLQEVFDKAGAAESRIAVNATNTPGDADSLFKIVNPGSYYLTGNITGVVGKHGVEIAASGSGVTLDLNGFDLAGVPGSLDGVSATTFGLTNLAVLNGSIRNWGGDGIDLRTSTCSNCRVEHVLAASNAGNGITVGEGCTVSENTVRLSGLDGIRVSFGCLVRSNNCSFSGQDAAGGAGIHATSARNRIEENHCTNADRGIEIDLFGNAIFRNTCSGNDVGWKIAANNVFGPILDRTSSGSVTFSGNAAVDSSGTDNPNANFTY